MAAQPRRAGTGAILLPAALLVLVACGAGAGGPRAGAPADGGGSTAGAVAPEAAAPAPRRVQLAYVSTATSFVGLWAAREYGLFEQYGLRPEDLLYINGGPAIAQALVAGEIDAGYQAFSPAVTAIASGAPLKIVAGVGYGFVHQLFTRGDSGINQPADMKGKRAGVSRIGSESHTVVRFWARSHGLQDDDIVYVSTGGAGERLAALATGSVDLLPLDPPGAVEAEKQGYRRLADLTREDLPWQQAGLTFRERTLREDPALSRAIAAAVIEGAYLARSDRERAVAVLARYIGEPDPDALEVAWQGYARKWNDRARPNAAGVQAVQDFVDESVPGTAREPYARFVDTSLLDELERDGFFTRLERQYPATERRSATVP
jgi:ABC-type nitrate/sulfonate/bicarbonate transport system substrate-binding protein